MDEFLDALRDDDLEALYDRSPSGLLSMDPNGTIVRVNQTFLEWSGFTRDDLVDRRTFASMLTAGGRIYHETHYAPLLHMHGRAREIAFDFVGADGVLRPALVSSIAEVDPDGSVRLVRTAVFDAAERRRYERELLGALRRAEESEALALVLAQTLQQTLIPPDLPRIDGLDVAAVYRPAGDGGEIGGDFYDVFQIGVDDWVIALGDVQGKGVHAAVVTALARYTIRAASVTTDAPSAVLGTLNEVLLRSASERACTAVVIRLRRAAGAWSASVGCAGHAPPLLCDRHGVVRELGRVAPLLGFFPRPEFHDTTQVLTDGDVITLYTDGVSEARRDRQWFGEARISDTIVRNRSSAADITDRLLADVLEFEGDDPRDDIAIVAIRVGTP